MDQWIIGFPSIHYTTAPLLHRTITPVWAVSEDLRRAFLEDFQVLAQPGPKAQFTEPAGRFVQGFEGKFERAVMHWHQPLRAQVPEDFDGFIRPHVHVPK